MMKRLLLIFSMIALLQDCAMNPAPAFGQYLGSTSQLTTSQSFTQTMTDLPTHLVLTNVGQVGHSLLLRAINSAASGCVVSIDGSQDGITYALLASVQGNTTNIVGTVVNGYFPILRLTFNYNGVSSCANGQVSGSYIGYQYPLPPSANNTEFNLVNRIVTGPVLLSPNFALFPSPWQIYSLVCSNPGTATAYAELFDQSTSPALGNSPMLEFGIPAGGTVTLEPKDAYTGFVQGWIAASTDPGGTTTVTTAIVCSMQYTNNTSVWPAVRQAP